VTPACYVPVSPKSIGKRKNANIIATEYRFAKSKVTKVGDNPLISLETKFQD